MEYQSEAYSSQDCPKCSHRSALSRKTQETFACVSCGFQANADDVAAHNQLAKFVRSDKGVALLASGYRASVNSLWMRSVMGCRNVSRKGDSPRNSVPGIPRLAYFLTCIHEKHPVVAISVPCNQACPSQLDGYFSYVW